LVFPYPFSFQSTGIQAAKQVNFWNKMLAVIISSKKLHPMKVIEQKKNVIAAPKKVNASYSKNSTFSRCNQRAHVL
jgi:hypothetical protein